MDLMQELERAAALRDGKCWPGEPITDELVGVKYVDLPVSDPLPSFGWLSWAHVVADWRRYRRRAAFSKRERHYDFVNERRRVECGGCWEL